MPSNLEPSEAISLPSTVPLRVKLPEESNFAVSVPFVLKTTFPELPVDKIIFPIRAVPVCPI